MGFATVALHQKAISVKSNTSFNDLVTRLYKLLCNGSQVKLKLVYCHPINLRDGNFNFVALSINDDDDVSLMFNVTTNFPPCYTIELYVKILLVEIEDTVEVDDALKIGENKDDDEDRFQ